MTTTHKEIYASAEESLSVMSKQKATAAQLEALRLIDEAGLNEQGVSTQHYVQGVINICAQLLEQRDSLRSAILLTLQENSHLADGEDCTLIRLKKAVDSNDRKENAKNI